MKPLTHILAATDLSAASLDAVDRGFLLAKAAGAQLTVIHALGLDPLAPLRELLGEHVAAFTQKASDAAHNALQRLVGDPARNHGLTATLRIEPGPPLAAIVGYAQASAPALIVLGAHGKGFLQRMLLGSTTSRLLRKSRCPVLIVKEPARYDYQRALVAVDFSPGSTLALSTARACAPGAELLLLHVVDLPFEGKLRYAGVSERDIQHYRDQARVHAERQMHELAKAAGLAAAQYTTRVAQGDTARQILAEEEAGDCDLIVVGKHGTHVSEELLLGSVTKHVLAESRADVLVVTDARAPGS